MLIEHPVSPTAIRRAVNVTPTKPRRTSNVTSPASKTRTKAFERTPSQPTNDDLSPDMNLPFTDTGSPELPLKTSKTWDQTPATHSRPSASQPTASAAFRRISDTRYEALRASPRRESIPPTSKKSPRRMIATHVEIPVKPGRGRPPKAPKVATPAPAPAPVAKSTPPSTKSLGKRKRSIGSADYTPDSKRKKSIGSEEFTPSSLKKKTRSTPAKKKVDFADPLVSSGDEEDDLPLPVAAAAAKTKPKASKPKAVSKAAAAGKAARKTTARKKKAPKVTEKIITESEYERRVKPKRKGVASGVVVKRGVTRSGGKFK